MQNRRYDRSKSETSKIVSEFERRKSYFKNQNCINSFVSPLRSLKPSILGKGSSLFSAFDDFDRRILNSHFRVRGTIGHGRFLRPESLLVPMTVGRLRRRRRWVRRSVGRRRRNRRRRSSFVRFAGRRFRPN